MLVPCIAAMFWTTTPPRDDRAALQEMLALAKQLPDQCRLDREMDMTMTKIEMRLREIRGRNRRVMMPPVPTHSGVYGTLLEFLEFYVPRPVIESTLGVRSKEVAPYASAFVVKSVAFQIMLRVVDWFVVWLLILPLRVLLRLVRALVYVVWVTLSDV